MIFNFSYILCFLLNFLLKIKKTWKSIKKKKKNGRGESKRESKFNIMRFNKEI